MLRNLAYIAFSLLIVVLPMENVLLLEDVGTISRLLGLIALPLCLPYIVWRGKLRFHWLMFWFALFVCWAALTLVWADSVEPLRAVQTPVQLLLLVWLIIQMVETPPQVEMTFMAYVLGCSVAAISTIHDFLDRAGVGYQRFVASGFDPNDMALILALGLPMAMSFVLRGSRLRALVGLIYVPLGLYAILLTASRTGVIAAAVAFIYPLLLVNDRVARTRLLILLALVGAAVAGGLSSVPETSWARIATIWPELSEGSLNGRTSIWASGLAVFDQNAIVGVGLGNFHGAMYQEARMDKGAHNVFLYVAAELGLVGLVIFVATLGTAIWGLQRLPPPERRLWYVLLMVLGLAFMLANWQVRKQTWLILTLAASHGAMYLGQRRRPLVAAQGDDDPLRRSGPLRSPRRAPGRETTSAPSSIDLTLPPPAPHLE